MESESLADMSFRVEDRCETKLTVLVFQSTPLLPRREGTEPGCLTLLPSLLTIDSLRKADISPGT